MPTALLLQNIEGFPAESSRRYAAGLSAALIRLGCGWRFDMPRVPESAGVISRLGRANASRWDRLVRYPRLVRRWRSAGEPDVTHLLDHSHANLLRACDPARSVVTLHDVIPMLSAMGELDFKRGRLVGLTFARKLKLISRCAGVIVPSQATKRQLLRFIDISPERIVVVPHGVERRPGGLWHEGPEDERERVLTSHSVATDRQVVLHVCTRNRYKNSPAILRMLARLPKRVVLMRVGAPLFEDETRLAETLGVADRVVDTGHAKGDAGLAEMYRIADVFVFPSIFEGFGWPPLEAMSCGTPVVTSNVASLPEVVGNAGDQVDPQDDHALAQRVQQLLEDATFHRVHRNRGLVRAAAFSWQTCAQRTLAVYQQIASGGLYEQGTSCETAAPTLPSNLEAAATEDAS